MSFSDLITVSDYAKAHGILPAQAADLLSQLGMFGANDAPNVVPAVIHSRSPFIGELEVVI